MGARVKKSIVRTRKDCRLCGSLKLELALPMRPSPIGDAFVTKEQLTIPQDSYSLSLFLCMECGHLQLPDVIDPEVLFGNYIYLTSTSPGLVEHFRKYADNVLARLSLPKDSLVVEIGSNDGSLLKFFQGHGMKVLGIDPARDIAQQASTSGVETLPTFFTLDVSQRIKEQHGTAAVMTANNVFAHADNMTEIVDGIQNLLSPEGVFVFEVSYLPDMIEKNVFDTIYHEHLCHHRIQPLETLFNRYGMCLFDVERVPTKGGSIRGFAKKLSSQRAVSPIIQEMIQREKQMGLDKVDVYMKFAERLELIKTNLNAALDKLKAAGKSIAGYGASTPNTTVVYQFELGKYLDFIADDNSIKQGRFSPGHHIPVLPSEVIYNKKPDCIVIIAWQYAELIMKKHRRYLEEGGCFIVPLPGVKIVEKKTITQNESITAV